jgi:hypothetical protein
MDHRRNSKVQSGRVVVLRGKGNRKVLPSIKRLPSDFCWKLGASLCESLRSHMSSSAYSTIQGVFRRRDVVGYYALDTQYGLQCITSWVQPEQGNPATLHMLSSVFRKCTDLELIPSKERKANCLDSVVKVDSTVPALRPEWLTDPVYLHAKDWIEQMLGPVPSEDAIAFSVRHGPGSTASTPFAARSGYFKYSAWPYKATPSAQRLLTDCIQTDLRWRSVLEDAVRRHLDIPMWAILDQKAFLAFVVDGTCPFNVVTTVPKDGRKDRPIAKEQLGNIYLQLGVGAVIRSRLRGFGIDLNHQQEINRRIALEASRSRRYFTIDLSNASDTVGYDLVKALLPTGWFQLLDSLRSPWGTIPGDRSFLYRKFSSMGNGFTFELESVIFRAICAGISREFGHRSDRFAVFGDDIIGPDYLYLHHLQYLSYSGFSVNSEKSFHGRDRVRESCGVDALDGRNIRPVFCKNTPRNAMELTGLRNRIRLWFFRQLGYYPADLDAFFIRCFDVLPPIGPDSDVEFDGWLHDGYWAEGRTHECMVPTTTELPARDLGFRKLMHDLRCCTGEGGNFLVSEPSERVRLVGRVVGPQGFDSLTA